MIEFLTIVNRGLSVIASVLPAVIWHWMTARGHSRRQTFFGARIKSEFIESDTGQAILKEFRWRLWSWSVAGAAVSLLIPLGLGALAGSLIGSLAGSVAFALANRRTRLEAEVNANSTLRVAPLLAESEAGAPWLSALDWLAMLVPPVVPAATLMLLCLHWSQLPAEFHRGGGIFPAFFGLILGLMCTANQWALRFRARSSDWAPTQVASHRYRTYLGAMQAFVFAFITCQLCALELMQLNGAVPFMRHLGMDTYFLVSFPAQALWLIFIWRIRFWLTNHLATQSSDPMPDSCWKWGCIYFNPSDPALVVPLRTGIGQSFNCARPSVWVAGGAVTLLTIASLAQSVGLLTHISRHFPN
jgi:uncharacterized membrane protein